MTSTATEPRRHPIVFLLGPPGVGKSTLGRRACGELHLEFIDLEDSGHHSDPDPLSCIIADRTAYVVELPWSLQHDQKVLSEVRRSGVPLLLWAHPEDMQARSGHDEPLFTPVPRLTIRGGFGRNGTSCREFRRLDRACSCPCRTSATELEA